MNDPVLSSARDLLLAMPNVGKVRVLGAPLETCSDPDMPRLLSPELEAALSSCDALNRDMTRELILALDVMAVVQVDTPGRTFDDRIQKISGNLREKFTRRYKTSPYAEA
ncbi:MAG: hypothetical protein AB8B94_19485 [Hyphomicrobiales bacterium]